MGIEHVNATRNVNKGLLRDNELYQYLLETSVYPREEELLKELREVTANHPDVFMVTTPDSGQLLGLLLKLTKAKKSIEIGVFTGYSLLLTSLTIPSDGKITAIDPDQEAYNMGLPIIKKAGVEHKINFIPSAALPVLDHLLQDQKNVGSFDFAYVDADKENYKKYHEKLLELVKPGGVIVYDNTLWGATLTMPEDFVNERRKSQRPYVKEFNTFLAADPRISISQVPAGDGMTICMLH